MATYRERRAVAVGYDADVPPAAPKRAPDLGDRDVEIRRELSFDGGPIKSMHKDGGV